MLKSAIIKFIRLLHLNPNMLNEISEKIAGEITLSENPGKTIKKWREAFHVSQYELAEYLQVAPSVISDYEGGRRKAPRLLSIKKIVMALIEIDKKRGGNVIKQYTMMEPTEAIFAMKEFPIGVSAKKFLSAIEGEVLECKDGVDRDIYGYTVIDSLRAITSLTSSDYLKIYGWSSERALIFTGVKFGRSPMVAIRAHPMKPAIVVFHKPERIDELALKLSKLENIPLVRTDMPMDRMIAKLKEL